MNPMEMTCPTCGTIVVVDVSPMVPRKGPLVEITNVAGCPHTDHLASDDHFYKGVIEALEERDEAAYDREMDNRMERERDRAWENRGWNDNE